MPITASGLDDSGTNACINLTTQFIGRAQRPRYEQFIVHGRSNDGLGSRRKGSARFPANHTNERSHLCIRGIWNGMTLGVNKVLASSFKLQTTTISLGPMAAAHPARLLRP